MKTPASKLRSLLLPACLLPFGLALMLAGPVAADMRAGERIDERGLIDDDYYAAGGRVDIDAEVNGDLVVAGGEVRIGHRVAGDIIAAAGTLRIRGEVGDDLRASGGDIGVDADIGDDLVLSGGTLRLAPATRIGGDAWLAGGEIHIDGTIGGDIHVIGGDISLGGNIQGNVELEGGRIVILDNARIAGRLKYRSPRPAETASGASIAGAIDHEIGDRGYGDGGFGLLLPVTLALASVLFYLLFPRYTSASVRRIGADPFTSFGLGFLFFLFTPLLAVFLMLIVLGLWIGLSLLALYCVALLAGLLIACFFVAERGAKLLRQDVSSRARRLVSVIIAIFVLGLLQSIPLLGSLLLFVLLLFGLGAGLAELRYVYREPAAGA